MTKKPEQCKITWFAWFLLIFVVAKHGKPAFHWFFRNATLSLRTAKPLHQCTVLWFVCVYSTIDYRFSELVLLLVLDISPTAQNCMFYFHVFFWWLRATIWKGRTGPKLDITNLLIIFDDYHDYLFDNHKINFWFSFSFITIPLPFTFLLLQKVQIFAWGCCNNCCWSYKYEDYLRYLFAKVISRTQSKNYFLV